MSETINTDAEVPDIEIDATMIRHVTVVPSDRIMLINGLPITFDYPHPDNLHALQWNQEDKRGHLEFTDSPNVILEEKDYGEKVLPYVRLYAKEQAKNWDNELANYKQELETYNSTEARMQRLKDLRDMILARTDYLVLPDVAAQFAPNILQLIYKYRKMVRDIAKQEGAPWDGGGARTPWPKPPVEILKKQERKTEDNSLLPSEPLQPVFHGVPLDRKSYEISKRYGAQK